MSISIYNGERLITKGTAPGVARLDFGDGAQRMIRWTIFDDNRRDDGPGGGAVVDFGTAARMYNLESPVEFFPGGTLQVGAVVFKGT